jgi:hypothetical protein
MSTQPEPSGFADIEEWVLQQVYDQPKVEHMTYTLYQQLDRLLQSKPSQRDVINQIREATGHQPLSAEERVEERKLTFGGVQDAVETLIEAGWAKGERQSGVDGVYFTGQKLTPKGEAEAIRRKRKRAEDAEALASASDRAASIESIVRKIHKKTG